MNKEDRVKSPNSRLHPRVIIDAKVVSIKISEHMRDTVTLVKPDFSGRAIDICAEGMGILVEYYLPMGVHIDIQVEGRVFGIERLLKVKAEVRYCSFISQRKYRCGLKFLEISREDKETILIFVESAENRRAQRIKIYPDE